MISEDKKKEFAKWRNTPAPSLHELFMRNSRETPDMPAFLVSTGDRSMPIPWSKFARDVERVGWVIRTKLLPDLEEGQRCIIALLGENSYSWIVGHAACVFSGAIVLPLDPLLTPAEMAERLRFTGAKFVAYSALYAEKALATAKLLPGVPFCAFGSIQTDKVLEDAEAALATGDESIFAKPLDEDRVSMMVFTSGTTTKPRGVELTTRGLSLFAADADRVVPIKAGDSSLMMLPLHHIFGIAVAYTFLVHRVAMGVCPDFRRLFDAVQRFRCNHLFLVPALADILAQKIARRGETTEAALGTKILWIGTGGAPLSPKTWQAFTDLGVKMLNMYGLTETTALFSKDVYAASKPGTIGPGALVPDTDIKLSPDGELLIRSPAVMKGYYAEPELTAKALEGGYFHTGDSGEIDEDGYIRITGRMNRTIILSSGKKIAPEELEEKLLTLPGLREVRVSGEGESRTLTAEVYATVTEDIVRSEINAMNLQLPLHKRIRAIVIREEPFPRTSSGKLKL